MQHACHAAILLVTGSGTAMGQAPGDVSGAVTRALPVIAEGAEMWMAGRAPKQSAACNSCHVVTFSVWAHRSALRHGLLRDAAPVEAVTTWSLDDGGGTDESAQLVLALAPDESTARADSASRLAALVARIRESRQDDGTWTAGGQLPQQERPRSEVDGSTSVWALLALEAAGEPASTAELRRTAQVLDIAVGDAPESTEWRALRAWLEQRMDGDVAPRITALLEAQNDDGGWPRKAGESSDPLTTGQMLYLLPRLSVDTEHPAARRAADYLLATQRDDGSWPTVGTLARMKHAETWTSRYWGTAWSAIGLLETLDETRVSRALHPRPE